MVTHLGNSLLNACSGMTLPPALVLSLHFSVACWLGPISAGIQTVAKADVIASICMSDIHLCSGSPLCLASHSNWWYCEMLTMSTSSRWQLSVPTLSIFCPLPFPFFGGFLSDFFSEPPQHLSFQCPTFPHLLQVTRCASQWM